MDLPLEIVLFFILHWQISVFFQSFYLHRYSAHRMFTMSPRWERFFHLATYVAQGSSFLEPAAYAKMHRMHHAYSDTEKDPHSPWVQKNPLKMMWAMKYRFESIANETEAVEARFEGHAPTWPALDRFGRGWLSGGLWMLLYTAFYVAFATQWWHYLLLPLHFMMGPLHGFIVNWFGHWAGYRNFVDTGDRSRNTLVFDFLTAGELFQNNHHARAASPNFAQRWFEIDPTYPAIRVLAWLGAIQLRGGRRGDGRIADATQPSPGPSRLGVTPGE